LAGNRPVLEVDLVRQEDRVRLAEKIVFYKPTNEDEILSTLPSKPHLSQNQDAVYQAFDFTNINGIHLPLSFELTRFRDAGQGEDGSRRYPQQKWVGKIRSVNPACSVSSFVPQLPSDHNIPIRDMRL